MNDDYVACYSITSTTLTTKHEVYLNDIGRPEEFRGLLCILNNAVEGDLIDIFINSCGGDIYAGMQIINAIESCKGHVQTILDGECSSMGGFIFLVGHSMRITEHSFLMLHNFTMGMVGKGGEVINCHANLMNIINKLTETYASKILSEAEISSMLKGEDLYFNAEEVSTRLTAYMEQLNKEEELPL